MFASVRGRSRTNSRRQITLATRNAQPPILGIALEPLADVVNVGAFLVGQVAFDQLVHLVERDQRSRSAWPPCRAIRHEHFVGLLDDRAVAAAVMPGAPGWSRMPDMMPMHRSM